MAPKKSPVRRLVLAGGFAVAIAAAPAVAILTVSPADSMSPLACPSGETEDLYTDNCVPEMSPNVPGGNYPTEIPGGSLPEVSGIPCTGANSGQCIGLEEEQGNVPQVTPHSSLSSSP
jgi:hypothetical protein